MDAVKVEYTVKPEFVETNKANVARVMDALRAKGIPGLKYSTFLLEDGVTFVHIAYRADEAAAQALNDLQEFQEFQQALRASGPVSPPRAMPMGLVGTNWDFF